MNGKKNAAGTMNGKQEPITKVEAGRRVFQKHGKDLMPTEIIRLVKAEHGLDLTPAHASNLKSTLTKEMSEKNGVGAGKGKGKKKGGHPAKVTAESQPQLAAAQTKSPSNQGLVSLEEITAVKKLAERLGASELKYLIDTLCS